MTQLAGFGFSFRVFRVFRGPVSNKRKVSRKGAKTQRILTTRRAVVGDQRAIVFVIFAAFAPLRETSFLSITITLRGLASVERKSSRDGKILTDCSAQDLGEGEPQPKRMK